jgi:hypothetical protein
MVGMTLACAFLLGGYALLWQIGEVRGINPPPWIVRLAFLAPATVVSVVVHEAGHRIAGAAVGWRCVRFGFGPFEFYRVGAGWERQRVKMLWGAFVRQVPASFIRFRREKVVTLMSSPISSLVFGCVFAAIAMMSSSSAAFALFGTLSLLTILGSLELIPATQNGIASDGYRLRQVIRGGQAVDNMQRESFAEASNFTNLRYRDWPHALIARLAAGDDPYNVYLAYLHALDAGDCEAASGYMRRLIASLPEDRPYSYFACEASYWLAMYAGDPEGARKWLERTGRDVDSKNLLRVQAAVALANGQPDRADSLAKGALEQISTPASFGSEQFEVERLRHVLRVAAASGAARC